MLITWLVEKIVHRKRETGHKAVFYPLAILSTGITTLFFSCQRQALHPYGIFINSFVINLVSTPGGL